VAAAIGAAKRPLSRADKIDLGIGRMDRDGVHLRPVGQALCQRLPALIAGALAKYAAASEANGMMRSRDRGESWEDCTQDLLRFAEQEKYKSRIVSQTEIEGMLDGHALACTAAAPGTVFLANRMGLFRSDDRGAHWRDIEVGRFSPLTYGRDLRVSPHIFPHRRWQTSRWRSAPARDRESPAPRRLRLPHGGLSPPRPGSVPSLTRSVERAFPLRWRHVGYPSQLLLAEQRNLCYADVTVQLARRAYVACAPPGVVRFRRISPVAAYSGDRLLSEPTAGTQSCRREPLVMPQSRPCALEHAAKVASLISAVRKALGADWAILKTESGRG
jgi:hypothetical protein